MVTKLLSFFAVGSLALFPAISAGQGFGKIKKSLTLERALPAAVKLPGSSFDVKASAQNKQYADICDKIQATIQTQLIRFNSDLTLDSDRPAVTITIKVLNYSVKSTPQADPLAASLRSKKGAAQQPQPTSNRVNADLSVTYQTRTRAGASVDAEPIEVKYSAVFSTASETVSKTKELLKKIPHPGSKKPAEEDETPHTVGDVEQILVNRLAERVAARLVNTHEKVEVQLARGKLDDANKYAEAGQWTKYVEELETMTPLASATDDAYRIYNIGVGDEALGYKAETPAGAKKYFEQAVVKYRAAGEANPKERYFLEPLNRIEVALEHYKKLAAPAPAAKPAKKKSK